MTASEISRQVEQVSALRRSTIDDLLSGYIDHVKLASRIWIAVAILSVYALSLALNSDAEATSTEDLKLPFVDLSLQRSWVLVLAAGVLFALTVRWTEAHARAVRTRTKLVTPLLRTRTDKEIWDARVFLGTPTVWSLPLSVAELKSPRCRLLEYLRWLGLPYFLLLKLLSMIVHYGLPAAALIILLRQHDDVPGLAGFGLGFVCIFGCAHLSLGFLVELGYAGGATTELLRRIKRA